MAFVDVKDLSVDFRGSERSIQAVRNVGFSIDKGETVALVGESGSGKSVSEPYLISHSPLLTNHISDRLKCLW